MQQLRSATWIFCVIAAMGAAGAQQQTTPAQPIPPAGNVDAQPVTPGASATPVTPGTVPEVQSSGASGSEAAASRGQQQQRKEGQPSRRTRKRHSNATKAQGNEQSKPEGAAPQR